MLAEEFAVDLGSCLRWGNHTVPCLWPVTDVSQLKIHWVKVQLAFCMCDIITFILCTVLCGQSCAQILL
jgi:hypothetical protein